MKPNRQQRRAWERQQRSRKPASSTAASRHLKAAQSPSAGPLADKARGIAACEEFDGFAPLRNGLKRVAKMRGDWAGIPMPLTGRRLVIEPTYPKAAELAEIGLPEEATDKLKVRGKFWSRHKRGWIVTWDDEAKPGKVDWGFAPSIHHHLEHDLATLGCADAWGIEQERNAVQLLGSLVRHRQLKQYLLTGMFLEKSERSGVHYLFRRLKPTVAMTSDGDEAMHVLATLCMHPIAFYEGTWAGAMAPTDDVVAHLMLMRADEPMFWRRSNQHPPHVPEAGL